MFNKFLGKTKAQIIEIKTNKNCKIFQRKKFDILKLKIIKLNFKVIKKIFYYSEKNSKPPYILQKL